jgi:hypothetical protein
MRGELLRSHSSGPQSLAAPVYAVTRSLARYSSSAILVISESNPTRIHIQPPAPVREHIGGDGADERLAREDDRFD